MHLGHSPPIEGHPQAVAIEAELELPRVAHGDGVLEAPLQYGSDVLEEVRQVRDAKVERIGIAPVWKPPGNSLIGGVLDAQIECEAPELLLLAARVLLSDPRHLAHDGRRDGEPAHLRPQFVADGTEGISPSP